MRKNQSSPAKVRQNPSQSQRPNQTFRLSQPALGKSKVYTVVRTHNNGSFDMGRAPQTEVDPI